MHLVEFLVSHGRLPGSGELKQALGYKDSFFTLYIENIIFGFCRWHLKSQLAYKARLFPPLNAWAYILCGRSVDFLPGTNGFSRKFQIGPCNMSF